MTDHPPFRPGPPPRRTGARRWWAVAGTVLGVTVAVAGLAVLGFFIVMLVAFNSYASNK